MEEARPSLENDRRPQRGPRSNVPKGSADAFRHKQKNNPSFRIFSRQTQLSLKALFPRFRQVAVRICHSRQIRREENKSGRSGNQSRHVPSASWWGEKDIYKYMRCLAAEYQSQRPIVKSSACPGPQRQQIVAALETANREFGSQPYIDDK